MAPRDAAAPGAPLPNAPLLEVDNLSVEFPGRRGTLRALDGVTFSIAPGEVLGVVGESGAGKSLTGAAIIGLLERPGRISGGQVLLDGVRIDRLPYEQLRRIRGRQVGAIFQDPLTTLDPLYTVGRQLAETMHGTAVMLVTHDMGVIAETADRVAVMYAGRIVEIGPVREVIQRPSHPYTEGLMASIPALDVRVDRLRQIDGAMPRLTAIPPGCPYNPRCPKVFARCVEDRPGLMPARGTQAACWLHDPAHAEPGRVAVDHA